MILVTGGTGLVGCHLMYHLLTHNRKIVALRRESSNLNPVKKVFKSYTTNYESYLKKIDWIIGDINDIDSISNAFQNIDEVYHCAAFISFESSDLEIMKKINVEGTANMVNCSIDFKVKKFCYVSSIAAIGLSTNEFTDENTEWIKTSNPYSNTKKDAEMEVWRGVHEGLNAVIVNPGVIIGNGFWKRGSGVIFTQVSRGLKYFTTGSTGFVCVTDVVNVMFQLMEKNIFSERFIIIAENLSFEKVFKLISKNLGLAPPTKKAGKLLLFIALFIDYMRSKIKSKKRRLSRSTIESTTSISHYSNSKVLDALNYKFKSIEKSIKETSQHFLDQ